MVQDASLQTANSQRLELLTPILGQQQDPQNNPEDDQPPLAGQDAFIEGELPDEPSYYSYPIYGLSAGATGRVWGDPFFRNMMTGETYEILGEVNGEDGDADDLYNIYSDHGVHLNARFSRWRQNNANIIIMSEIGLVVNGNAIHFNRDGNLITLNGQQITAGQSQDFDGGSISVSENGRIVQVNTAEVNFTFEIFQGSHINVEEVRITPLGIASDGVLPNGLLGQTVNPFDVRVGEQGARQGEGTITGVVGDYEVEHIISINNQHSVYGGPAVSDEVSQLIQVRSFLFELSQHVGIDFSLIDDSQDTDFSLIDDSQDTDYALNFYLAHIELDLDSSKISHLFGLLGNVRSVAGAIAAVQACASFLGDSSPQVRQLAALLMSHFIGRAAGMLARINNPVLVAIYCKQLVSIINSVLSKHEAGSIELDSSIVSKFTNLKHNILEIARNSELDTNSTENNQNTGSIDLNGSLDRLFNTDSNNQISTIDHIVLA